MRRWAPWLGLWAAAALLRWLYWLLAEPAPIMEGLTHKYLVIARHAFAGEGFMMQVTPGAEVPFVDRLPGYVLVIGMSEWLAQGSRSAMVLIHAALAALQVPALVALGRRTVGEKAAWLGGIAWALFPPAWNSDTQLIETGVTGAALAGTCWALAAVVDEPSSKRIWLLATLATTCLVLRPDNLLVPLAVLLVAALLLPARRTRRLWPLLVLPLIVCLPWAARNARVADGFFVTVGSGNILLQGYGEFAAHPDAPYGDKVVARSEGHDSLFWPEPATRDSARRARALRLIAADPVGWLSGCARRVPILLSMHAGELWPGGEGLREHVERWRQENPGAARFEGLLRAGGSYLRERPLRAGLTLAWGPLLLGLALAGSWRLRRAPHLLLLLLWSPVYGLLLHLPLHAEPRYFFPHAGVLTLLAAAALLPPLRRPGSERPRVLALMATLEDARTRRRLRGLREQGFEVDAVGFRRDEELEPEPGAESLGRLPHGRYLLRSLRYLLLWPRVALRAWRADVVLAIGSDLLALANRSAPPRSVVLGEIADVREALVGEGLGSRLLRRWEARVLRRADLVVATSPELAEQWLVGRQRVDPARVQVIENKPERPDSNRPSASARRDGPIRIGWFGLLRCAKSWRVLREAAARSEGRLEVLLRGVARDLPRLQAEAEAAVGVEWGGPYRSPEDLAEMYGSVDAAWIAHAHGRANSEWARANRFYEGGWFGTPLIAQAGTPDGRTVEEEGLGLVLDVERPEEAVDGLSRLDREQLLRWAERLRALPDERFVESGEHGRLSAKLKALLEEKGVEFRSPSAEESSRAAPR